MRMTVADKIVTLNVKLSGSPQGFIFEQ